MLLLKKYGGLQFYDIDTKKNCYLSKTECVWLGRRRGNEGGWGLKGYDEDWDKTNPK